MTNTLMRVLVCGSKTITKIGEVETAVSASGWTVNVLISGGASGVDQLAEQLVKNMGRPIPLEQYKPDWKTYGKAAGMIRNELMVDAADVVIAVWDGRSNGTRSTIDYAKKLGKPLYIWRI